MKVIIMNFLKSIVDLFYFFLFTRPIECNIMFIIYLDVMNANKIFKCQITGDLDQGLKYQ